MSTRRLAAGSKTMLGLASGGYHYSLCSRAPTANKAHDAVREFAVISSDSGIRTFKPAEAETSCQVIGRHEDVSCLCPFPGSLSGGWITGGRDGLIKHWDERTGRVPEGDAVWEYTHEKKAPYLSVASSSKDFLWASGTELTSSEANVQIWDFRNQAKPLVSFVECHSDDVCVLNFSSFARTTLLSGSTDGLVNVYAPSFPEDENDALGQVINHGSSVHLAGFVPQYHADTAVQESIVYAVSHDETLSFYKRENSVGAECEDGGGNRKDTEASASHTQQNDVHAFGDVRPLLNCEYVIDVLTEGEETYIAVGNHTESRVNLYSFSSILSQLFTAQDFSNASLPQSSEYAYELQGAHQHEIVRAIAIANHAQQRTLVTAGEDGHLSLWPAPLIENPHEQEVVQNEAFGEEDERMSDAETSLLNEGADTWENVKVKKKRKDVRRREGHRKSYRPY